MLTSLMEFATKRTHSASLMTILMVTASLVIMATTSSLESVWLTTQLQLINFALSGMEQSAKSVLHSLTSRMESAHRLIPSARPLTASMEPVLPAMADMS